MTKCTQPFLKYANSREQTKIDTYAKIIAFLSPADCDDTADDVERARNDTLQDGGGDPQKQAPPCPEVSPDPVGVIRKHLMSITEESSVMDGNEDGCAEDSYTIQNLADDIRYSVVGRRSTATKSYAPAITTEEEARLYVSSSS